MKVSFCLATSTTLGALLLVVFPSVAQEWELLYQEDFTNGLPDSVNNAQWVLEDYSKPFDTIMDDNGVCVVFVCVAGSVRNITSFSFN